MHKTQILSLLYFWTSGAGICIFAIIGGPYVLFMLPCLVALHHGAHEAVHGTLAQGKTKTARTINLISGVLAFSAVGHNFMLLKWSHHVHHLVGRSEKEFTIDASCSDGKLSSYIKYYSQLFGASYWYHEFLGYARTISPYSRVFEPAFELHGKKLGFIITQVIVIASTSTLLFYGGLWFLIVRFAFGIYWGLGQNIAHYGLEVGNWPLSSVAARTYRVNPIINFLFFGASFYHAEHHGFPDIPGCCLNEKVSSAFKKEYGVTLVRKHGLRSFFSDSLQQLKGPRAEKINRTEWRS